MGLLLAFTLPLWACGEGSPEGLIDRETFIAIYVELRLEAGNDVAASIEPTRKLAVLEKYGVSEQNLLEFAEAHGSDAPFMSELWSEVEALQQGEPEPADTIG